MKNIPLYQRFFKVLQLKKNVNKFVSVSDLLKMTSPYANRASSYVFEIRKLIPGVTILNTKVWSKEAKCLIGYYMLVTNDALAEKEINKRNKKLGKRLTVYNASSLVSGSANG